MPDSRIHDLTDIGVPEAADELVFDDASDLTGTAKKGTVANLATRISALIAATFATTTYVDNSVAAVVAGADAANDTLAELGARIDALGNGGGSGRQVTSVIHDTAGAATVPITANDQSTTLIVNANITSIIHAVSELGILQLIITGDDGSGSTDSYTADLSAYSDADGNALGSVVDIHPDTVIDLTIQQVHGVMKTKAYSIDAGSAVGGGGAATQKSSSQFAGNGTHQTGVTFNLPAGIADGDEILVVLGTYQGTAIPAPTATGMTFTQVWSDDLVTGDHATAGYRARAVAADANKPVTISATAALALVTTGAADAAPTVSAATEAAAVDTIDPAAVTPAGNGACIYAIGWAAGIRTVTAPGNMTPTVLVANGGGRRTPNAAHLDQTTAAAFDPATFAITGGTTNTVLRTAVYEAA